MAVGLPTSTSSGLDRGASSFASRRAERKRLVRCEQVAARLAELHHLRALLVGSCAVVDAGWIQHGWFAYRDDEGRERVVGAHNLHQIADRPLTGACLVGAIVHAGGGLAAARSEPVHHALDLTWQALFQATAEPVGFCQSPASRVARVRELTWWNDRPHRSAQDVTALLDSADRAAAARIDALRRETALTV